MIKRPDKKSGCFLKKFGGKTSCHYLCRPLTERRVGQGVKTPPFHGGITGSIPVRGTKKPFILKGFFNAPVP
jgi:hypothetical protein